MALLWEPPLTLRKFTQYLGGNNTQKLERGEISPH